MNYDTLTGTGMSFGDGSENPSGIGEKAWLIPLSWMKTIAKPATPITTAALLATIATAHVMKTGKAPIPVTALFEKSGLSWELQGETLSKIFSSSVELFVPSNAAANLGTLQAIKNYRYILLISKSNGSNSYWQIGSEAIAANVTAMAGGTGQGATGEVGTRITLQAFNVVPVYHYNAEVPPVGPAE